MTREWYFQVMGQEIGPLTAAELKSKTATGQIQPDTLVRKGIEGKWIFAVDVKGLIAAPPEPPSPPMVSEENYIHSEAAAASTRAAVLPTTPTKSSTGIPTSVRMSDEPIATAPSHEFYDFVGFREAISPVLHDAVKQFAADCEISLSQMNRRALADFIRRPELGSDLSIPSVTALVPSARGACNPDDRFLPQEHEANEMKLFRCTFRNTGDRTIRLNEGVFLPTMVTPKPSIKFVTGASQPHTISNVVAVNLHKVAVGKAVRALFDISIPPHSDREIVIEFRDAEPKSVDVSGHLLLSHGGELTLSDIFSISLHG